MNTPISTKTLFSCGDWVNITTSSPKLYGQIVKIRGGAFKVKIKAGVDKPRFMVVRENQLLLVEKAKIIPADIEPVCAEVRRICYVASQATGKEEPAMMNESILPLALREIDIDSTDVEAMLRVANDRQASSGRYKRVPKRLPSTNQPVDHK